MITYKKIEELFADFSETAANVSEADLKALKDQEIGKLFLAGENIISAVERFINMIDSELMEREEILIPETGEKIVKTYEPVLKIEKACDCKSESCCSHS